MSFRSIELPIKEVNTLELEELQKDDDWRSTLDYPAGWIIRPREMGRCNGFIIILKETDAPKE